MDNGSLHLNNVRIPRTQLLMRFYKVSRDGTYEQTGSRKLIYSTLTFTRKQIILSAGAHLSRSVVVAIRYGWLLTIVPRSAALGDVYCDFLQECFLLGNLYSCTLSQVLGGAPAICIDARRKGT